MDEEMNIDEQKQVLIDYYTNLMRIKACEKSVNEELDYQIEVAKVKLSALGLTELSKLERK